MSNYQNGKIYRLIDSKSDETLFVGATTIPLCQKLAEFKYHHALGKSSKTRKELFNRIGPDNIYIELIEGYPCNNIEELKRKENEIKRSIKSEAQQPLTQIPLIEAREDLLQTIENNQPIQHNYRISKKKVDISILNQVNDMFRTNI